MARNLEEQEFGVPPELKGPEPSLEFSTPPPEFPETGPDIIEPGADPMRSKRKGSSRFYVMLLTMVLALYAGFGGTETGAVSTTARKHMGSYVPIGVTITKTAHRDEEHAARTEGSESSETAEGSSGSETESSTGSGTGSTENSSETTESSSAYMEPSCDIVVVGMASEIRGYITFANTDDVVLPVSVEFWDPETETMAFADTVEDLSEKYIIGFTTEHLYYENQAYYDAAGTFPFDVQIVVRMMLGDAESGEERVFTQNSLAAEIPWWSYYDNSTDDTGSGTPQTFVWSTSIYGDGGGVVYNQPELVTETSGIISVMMIADGELIPVDAVSLTDYETNGTAYGTDGNIVYEGEIHDFQLLIPFTMNDGVNHSCTLYVTQYIEGYGIVTLESNYRIEYSN